MENKLDNKELIVIGASFLLLIAISLYMFVSNQKNSTAVTSVKDLKEQHEAKLNELEGRLTELEGKVDTLILKIEATDKKFHSGGAD